METSSTVSRFPAPDTGQALSKYLREEGFLELGHAGVAVQRGPQGREEQGLRPGFVNGA